MQPANEGLFRTLENVLRTGGRSEKTIADYHQGVTSLESYLVTSGKPDTDLLEVTEADIMGWVKELQERGGWSFGADGNRVQRGRPLAADSINSYFRSARRFYNFLRDRDLIDATPFKGLIVPPTSQRPIDIPPDDLIRRMIAYCQPAKGKKRTYKQARDEFLIRLFTETGGPRCDELAMMPTDRMDLAGGLCVIEGKGGKWRTLPLSEGTVMAGIRYMRLRKGHRFASSNRLFLGLQGGLSYGGVYQAIKSISAACGQRIHPHQIRHQSAHEAKASGMPESDIMRLFGWSSNVMLRRYGAQLADERAVNTARQYNLGKRFA